MSHSKRNTSLAFFTSHERSLLRSSWGSQSTRLTRDSFLPFGSCRLCLLPARAPVVACASNGDLYCRECAVNDLLAQRKEIKRLERGWEKGEKDKEDDQVRREEEAKVREVEEFERGMQGYDGKRKRDAENGEIGREKRRKEFELDEAEMSRIARAKRDQTIRELEREKVRRHLAQFYKHRIQFMKLTSYATVRRCENPITILLGTLPDSVHDACEWCSERQTTEIEPNLPSFRT